MSLTCSEQDDLVIQGQLGEVGDPLGPLHQGEELFVCCLADVCHRVVGLPKKKEKKDGKAWKRQSEDKRGWRSSLPATPEVDVITHRQRK